MDEKSDGLTIGTVLRHKLGGHDSKPEVKRWRGSWPAKCDFCHMPLQNGEHFYDAATFSGTWGLFCFSCFNVLCKGLGTGLGQKYDSKTLEKVGG